MKHQRRSINRIRNTNGSKWFCGKQRTEFDSDCFNFKCWRRSPTCNNVLKTEIFVNLELINYCNFKKISA